MLIETKKRIEQIAWRSANDLPLSPDDLILIQAEEPHTEFIRALTYFVDGGWYE